MQKWEAIFPSHRHFLGDKKSLDFQGKRMLCQSSQEPVTHSTSSGCGEQEFGFLLLIHLHHNWSDHSAAETASAPAQQGTSYKMYPEGLQDVHSSFQLTT